MSIFFILLLITGVCIGSFLNVLIDRLPQGKSILGRSHCDKCKKTLTWKDLIPLMSFIYLRGKCRYCHTPLSYQYPLIELLTGLFFVIVYMFVIQNFQSNISELVNLKSLIINLIFYLIIISCLIVVFFADLKYGIIPDEVLIFGGIATFVWLMLAEQSLILNHIVSAVIAFLFFLLIFMATRGRGMGFGDVKLAFLIGLILGFPATFLALYIAFLTGGLIGIILILWKKKRLNSSVAFGPFLVLGTVICLFFAPIIIQKIQVLL